MLRCVVVLGAGSKHMFHTNVAAGSFLAEQEPLRCHPREFSRHWIPVRCIGIEEIRQLELRSLLCEA